MMEDAGMRLADEARPELGPRPVPSSETWLGQAMRAVEADQIIGRDAIFPHEGEMLAATRRATEFARRLAAQAER